MPSKGGYRSSGPSRYQLAERKRRLKQAASWERMKAQAAARVAR